MPRSALPSRWLVLVLVSVTVLLAGCSTFTVTRVAQSSYTGPDDLLLTMARGGVQCHSANTARRATADGGLSAVCATGDHHLLVVTTYPSAAARGESLQEAATGTDLSADVLVGDTWTVACEGARNCDRLEAILGGTIVRV